MDYSKEIAAKREDAAGLEQLYRAAGRAGEADAFRDALEAAYAGAPGDGLLAAWHYRLAPQEAPEKPAGGRSPWPVALAVSLVSAVVFGLLMDQRQITPTVQPLLAYLWAPLAATFVLAFLTLAGKLPRSRVLLVFAGLAGLTAYAYVLSKQPDRVTYATLMLVHLPLLAWVAAGVGIVGLRSSAGQRFAFLAKSIELFITGGLFLGVGGILMVVTAGLFQASGINLFEWPVFTRLAAAGAGLIPALATATIYDPRLSPLEQRFEDGLSRLLATLLRLALPLTLLVLAAYICVIPFNFMQPFQNRDVLIVYNIMLFAVMALLIGASPAKIAAGGLKGEKWLRAGLIVLAGLTLLVSLYAMSATIYRTVQGGLTPNRVTVIGWNVINIGILGLMLYRQARAGAVRWLEALHAAFSAGVAGYMIWTIILVVAMPWLFR